MHMADALISPAVGGIMIAAAAGTAAFSIKKTQESLDEKKIPLMGIMAAFVFAAQMINFTIPGTGSSGHLGGGLLLAIILGPYAGFLAMASVLIIQALFFADGGLLALGCNIMNLGFITCFIVYPLIFRTFTKNNFSIKRLTIVSIISAVIALQLGAFSVVIETLLSGKTELPFLTFVMLMQPIHGAIGIVEGFVTAAVVAFVYKSRPEIISSAFEGGNSEMPSIKRVAVVLAIIAIITGGVFSWFASENPDGLEWSMEKTSGSAELSAPVGIHESASAVQEKTAFMPDYALPATDNSSEISEEAASWPAVNIGTSLAGVLGGALVLLLTVFIGITGVIIRKFVKKAV